MSAPLTPERELRLSCAAIAVHYCAAVTPAMLDHSIDPPQPAGVAASLLAFVQEAAGSNFDAGIPPSVVKDAATAIMRDLGRPSALSPSRATRRGFLPIAIPAFLGLALMIRLRGGRYVR